MQRKTWLFLAVAAIAALPICLVHSADTTGGISGVVKEQSGQPIAGVWVTAKNEQSRFAVTVITQAGGRYNVANLPAGQYTVHATGDGLQTDTATVEVGGSRKVTENLSLNATADYKKVESMPQYGDIMPEGRARVIIVSSCTHCHMQGLQEIVYQRKTREEWDQTIEMMKNHPFGYAESLRIPDDHKALVVDYLAKNFGPDSAGLDESKFPKQLAQGDAAKAVAVEYYLPEGARPHDVTVSSKGIAWTTEGGLGVLGRIDPRTYGYEQTALPGDKSHPAGAAIDPQDRIWMADGGNKRMLEYDPTTKTFTAYALPAPPHRGAALNTIRFHPDGTVWATEIGGNQVLHLFPNTKEVTTIQVPTKEGTGGEVGGLPYGMAIDNTDTVWFVESTNGKISRIDPATNKLTEYDVPSLGDGLSQPHRMQSDSHGNLWFGFYGEESALGMVDTRTGKITEYPTPTKFSGCYSVDVDRVHDVIWVNEMMADRIARFDPRTKTFVEYQIPTRNTSVRRIEVDRSKPTRIWYAGLNKDLIGYIDTE